MLPGVFRRPASAIPALLLATLLGASVFGSGGLVQLARLRAERSMLGEEALRLLRANDELRQKIRRLRRSDHDLERLARQELGLVREGEIVYRFQSRADSRQPSDKVVLNRRTVPRPAADPSARRAAPGR